MSGALFEGMYSPRKEWCQARFEEVKRWEKGDLDKALARVVGLESLLNERDGRNFSEGATEPMPGVPQFLGDQHLGRMVNTVLGDVWMMDIRNDRGGVMPVAFSSEQAKEMRRRLNEALKDA